MEHSLRETPFRVIDIETTGFNPKKDAIVEMAWAIIRGDGEVLSQGDALVNPGIPIPPDASRIHGIYDDHVASAPRLDEGLEKYSELHTPALPAACHNAAFDLGFLRRLDLFSQGNPQHVCTLRLAENVLPGLSSYRLDALTRSLGLSPGVGGPVAHRAAGDVAMTCSLLSHLVERYLNAGHEDNLEAFCRAARIQRMPLGKHKGIPLREVPPDYLEWLLGRDIEDELRDALVDALRGETPSPPTRVEQARKKPWWWPF